MKNWKKRKVTNCFIHREDETNFILSFFDYTPIQDVIPKVVAMAVNTRNDDVQDFSPDWFVFHSFLGFELWLSVGANRCVRPNTSTLMVCCCYQCGGWRLMLSGQANPAPTSNPHRLRLNMPLWLLTHPFVSTHNSCAIKQKNSKTENSFFESTNKGKNTPYKIL